MFSSTFAPAGLTPFEEDGSRPEFETISLLDDFGAGSKPTFTIVDSKRYVQEIKSNSSSAKTKFLPPQFLLSVSYKPRNNTVLRLLSTFLRFESTPFAPAIPTPLRFPSNRESDSSILTPFSDNTTDSDSENQFAENDDDDSNSEIEFESGSGSTLVTPGNEQENGNSSLVSLILSLSATYLTEDKYLDIWNNVTEDTQHTVVFMVQHGSISSCLDGQYKPLSPDVSLWNESMNYDKFDLQFSENLHAAQSVVS